MTLLKNALTSVAMLSGGLLVAAPQDADAQIRFQIGGSGYSNGYGNYGHNHGHSRYNGYGYRNYDNYNYGTRYSGYGTRYNTYDRGHYDYHPTTVVPHGNHLHVQPGHYDYHYGH